MFSSWRRHIKEAQKCLEEGSVNAAYQLVMRHKLMNYQPGVELSQHIARSLTERAAQQARAKQWQSAFESVAMVSQVCQDPAVQISARGELQKLAREEVISLTEDGRYLDALGRIDRFASLDKDRGTWETLGRAIGRLRRGEALRKSGRLTEARDEFRAVVAVTNELKTAAAQLALVDEDLARARDLTRQIHQMMATGQWSDVAPLAQELIALQPDNRLALEAQRRCLAAARPESQSEMQPAQPVSLTQNTPSASSQETSPGRPSSQTVLASESPAIPPQKSLLWVDAVGGFQICRSEQVTVGQIGAQVHVSLAADISRHHLTFVRQGENYLLNVHSPVTVGGREVTEKTVLADGDLINLGQVQIRFRRPHPLTSSAVLTLESRHKFDPHLDAILLMADSLVLGPSRKSHVYCGHWTSEVVIYGQGPSGDDPTDAAASGLGGGLGCRLAETALVDGEETSGRVKLSPNSRVSGENFSFSLEEG